MTMREIREATDALRYDPQDAFAFHEVLTSVTDADDLSRLSNSIDMELLALEELAAQIDLRREVLEGRQRALNRAKAGTAEVDA